MSKAVERVEGWTIIEFKNVDTYPPPGETVQTLVVTKDKKLLVLSGKLMQNARPATELYPMWVLGNTFSFDLGVVAAWREIAHPSRELRDKLIDKHEIIWKRV